MKRISIIVVVVVAGYYLFKGGGGGVSGTANFTVDGKQYDLDEMEFRVEVNPIIGQTHPETVITTGSPQAIRFIVRNKSWPNSKGGKGFSISWWMRSDNPMTALESCVGKTREYDRMETKTLNMRVMAEGKTMNSFDGQRSWVTIHDIENGFASGTFAGTLELDTWNPTTGNFDNEPGIVEVADGYFMVPISKLYQQE